VYGRPPHRQIRHHRIELAARPRGQGSVVALAELVERDHAFGYRTFEELPHLGTFGI
jgi:hypothetical protein